MEDETGRHMEHIYSNVDEADIPWNRAEPPADLVRLIEDGTVKPCRALDIGCGTGNYSMYLARQGFDVTGVDISESAIDIARRKAGECGLDVNFAVADMRGDVSHAGEDFGFALEWMILHHILPDGRARYLDNLASLQRSGGLFLSVSFSAEDPKFGDPPEGNWRRSPMGPTVYLSHLEELEAMFSPYFDVIESGTFEIPGKIGNNRVNRLLLKKR